MENFNSCILIALLWPLSSSLRVTKNVIVWTGSDLCRSAIAYMLASPYFHPQLAGVHPQCLGQLSHVLITFAANNSILIEIRLCNSEAHRRR